jgi:predicted P-loop ATPase
MSHTFGCEDNEYHRAVSAKTVIAAVRRVRQPGCKFDHMVVIEGRQGIRKSTAIARLFGEKWFTDQISALGSKDAAVDLRGKWVIEVGEIDAIIKAEVETVKAFLSRSFDHYRPPYGEVAVDVPRQNIFIGTTNEHEYLRDTSGNRRFWPVRSNDQSVNIEWVSANRDQIWAEAAYREASGEPIWLDHADVQATAVAAQAERLTEDAWHPRIAAYVNAKAKAYDNGVKVNAVDGHMQSYPEGSRGRFVTTPELLEQCLNIPTAQQNRAAEMRAAGVLRTLGWDKKPEWDAKIAKTVRVWRQKGVVWSQKG